MRIHQVSEEIKQEIVYRYVELGYGQIKAGQPFGIGAYLVKRILQEANIPIRTFSEAATLSNANRAIPVNHSYFDEQSQNMAYLLGIYASDGTVRRKNNEIKLTLQIADLSFLEMIKKELQYEGTIKTFTTKSGFDNASLTFTSKKIKEEFARYNITPNKTNTFQFPALLERKYWRDFFRGYFDGDGTVCKTGSALRLSLCSNTKNILEVFIKFFEEEYQIPPVSIYERNQEGRILYYFQYSTNATRQFYNILYYENCLCLPRKYEKYTKLVNRFSTRL